MSPRSWGLTGPVTSYFLKAEQRCQRAAVAGVEVREGEAARVTLGDAGATPWDGEDCPEFRVHRLPPGPPCLHGLGKCSQRLRKAVREAEGPHGAPAWGRGRASVCTRSSAPEGLSVCPPVRLSDEGRADAP